ncbi:MAG: BrnT family toxin [Candidatus Obscuribacterales bacterium]|nr:BrnT family toxin [Candidatus Obscuribacterales bacterium]
MDFEFDPAKSQSNKEKHGIDFVGAQQIWDDPDRFELPARSDDEPRHLMIGKIDNKHWSAFFSFRLQKIRLISVRRSRKEEKELYES